MTADPGLTRPGLSNLAPLGLSGRLRLRRIPIFILRLNDLCATQRLRTWGEHPPLDPPVDGGRTEPARGAACQRRSGDLRSAACGSVGRPATTSGETGH